MLPPAGCGNISRQGNESRASAITSDPLQHRWEPVVIIVVTSCIFFPEDLMSSHNPDSMCLDPQVLMPLLHVICNT
ncbi:hypothetical protein GDO81_002461 [Engystomops pustulosus]|uniref:Uncharacterized protein n=1 Tax=Engystomops pustulosus TaxID=76066 RepID=A0AAV7DP45_ENGPU|nr:hypothetical protein GDO81_002461 [Engystomops pustulosus]KAG8598007.1 hypothetical protein GDO81_002461 [Engystomops pustulosus]